MTEHMSSLCLGCINGDCILVSEWQWDYINGFTENESFPAIQACGDYIPSTSGELFPHLTDRLVETWE